MPSVVCNGIELAYDDRGSGQPAFVFVHGWTCDRSFFAPQADYFARRHRVVSIDLRGHGESHKPEGEYAIATHADDVASVIEALQLGKVVAVGHSMGGLVVLQLGVAHADRVAAIVMVDPPPFVIPDEVKTRVAAMAGAIEDGDLEVRRRFITEQLFLPTADPELVADVLDVMLAAPPRVAAAAMRAILAFDTVPIAAQCRVPALHVSALPVMNPPDLMAQWLPNVVTEATVDAGHFNQLEAPDQVNAMIDAFVRRLA